MANKILVAEDDKAWQENVEVALKRHCEDVELTIVATREEALAAIENTDGIKVVITDLRMPDFGDGEAVAIAAQQKGIKVIVLSGTLNDLSEAVRGNCLAVLKKLLYDGETLGQAVNKGLNS